MTALLRRLADELDAGCAAQIATLHPSKRARVSLTLRLICGYLLRSFLPFLTCIYGTLLDLETYNIRARPQFAAGHAIVLLLLCRCFVTDSYWIGLAGGAPVVGAPDTATSGQRQRAEPNAEFGLSARSGPPVVVVMRHSLRLDNDPDGCDAKDAEWPDRKTRP